MRSIFCLCVLLMVAPAVFAESPPAEIAPYVHAAKPYGTGTVTYAFFTVYDAALWSDAKPFSMDKPFALQLTYRHSFSASSLADKTTQLMADIDNVPEAKLKEYNDQLLKLWPSVKSGDTITAVSIPAKKTLFYYNGAAKGAIEDPAFNKPFFDIWLSEKTTEPAARKSLLAGNN